MRIAVLLGGSSPERMVSIASGKGVINALRELGHDVTAVDPALGRGQISESELLSQAVGAAPPTQELLSKLSPKNYLAAIDSEFFDDIDLAFIILHGKWGEDGIVQSLLELRSIPYTGSGVMASAIAMDKVMSKKLFLHHGTPTADWYDYRVNSSPRSSTVKEEIARLGYPNVVKPNDQGSSVAITIVDSAAAIDSALDEAEKFSDTVLVEKFIEGAELTVAILGNEPLPVIEIRPHGGFYDYHHKYTKGMTDYIVPAPIEKSLAVKLQEISVKTFLSLGCRTFGRVDFRVGADGIPYCLEVNTIPGMTETSLVPKAAAAAGIPFKEAIKRIVELSHPGR
ncbi:MAG: D-alanine--D-alanine ligase [Bacteroidetes bacterium]|nr:D-alanine--D-alanine ligase [Bacteroidota bacterium]